MHLRLLISSKLCVAKTNVKIGFLRKNQTSELNSREFSIFCTHEGIRRDKAMVDNFKSMKKE